MALLMSADYPIYKNYAFDGFDYMIDEMTEFVSELSDTLDQGLFAGMDMTGAFVNTGYEEINHFLRFVMDHPFNYMSKSWKFSETYATWILNKAPLSRAHYRDVLLSMPAAERKERLPYFEEQISGHLEDWVKQAEDHLIKYDYPSSVALAQLAIELAQNIGKPKIKAELHRIRYEAYLGLNQDQRAKDELSTALEIYSSLNDEQGVQLCQGLMENLRDSYDVDVDVVIQSGLNMPFITAFHPSGKYFYTGGWDGFIKMWDTKSGLILATVKAHSIFVEAFELSGDGRFLLSCMDDGKAKIFNAKTLQLVNELDFKTDYVNNIDINYDGTLIAYTTGDKTTFIYNIAERKTTHKLKRHTKRVTDVCFGPKNKVLFTCAMDSFIYTWHVSDFSQRGWYKEGSEVHGVIPSPDRSLFATIRRDTSIGIWDFNNAERMGLAPTMFHRADGDLDICPPSFSPDNRFMTYILPNNGWSIVRLSDLYTHNFKNPSWDTLTGLIWHPKEMYLLKSSATLTLAKYDLSNYRFRETRSLTFVDNRPSGIGAYNVNFDTSGRTLVMYIHGEDNLLSTLDLETGERRRIAKGFHANDVGLFIDKSRNWIQYVDWNCYLCFRDLEGKLMEQIKTPIYDLGTFAIDKQRDQIIDRSVFDGRVRVMSLGDYDTLDIADMPFKNTRYASYAIHHSEESNVLYLSGGDRFLYVYDLTAKKLDKVCIGNKKLILRGIQPTSDDQILLLHTDQFIGLYNVETRKVYWKKKFKPDDLQYTYVDISSDMKYLAVADYYYHLEVIDIASEKPVYESDDFTYFISSLNFHPTLPILVVCSEDPKVKLINFLEDRTDLTIYPQLDGDLILMNQKGEYWADKDNLDIIAFKYKNNVYPVDQFDLFYNKPAEVLKQLPFSDPNYIMAIEHATSKRLERSGAATAGVGEIALPNAYIRNRDRLPALTEKKEVDLFFECTDFTDSITAYQISVNGIPLYPERGTQIKKADVFTGYVTIALNPKTNVVKLWSYNSKGYQSLKESVEINRTKESRDPDLYIGVLSVSDCANDDFDLKYPVKDAGDLIAQLIQDTLRFRNIYVKWLADSSAVLENLDSLRTFYTQAEVVDQTVLFVSGHGLLDDELDFYFATHDMDFDDPAARGITYAAIEDLLRSTPSRQRLLLMDACHSGEVDKEAVTTGEPAFEKGDIVVSGYEKKGGRVRKSQTQMGLQNSFNLMKELFAVVGSSSGVQVISAASGDSYALESDEWKNGVFTYSILKGLRDNAADRDNNGSIYVSELCDYVIEEVYRQTDGKQRPTVRSENIEFDFRVK